MLKTQKLLKIKHAKNSPDGRLRLSCAKLQDQPLVCHYLSPRNSGQSAHTVDFQYHVATWRLRFTMPGLAYPYRFNPNAEWFAPIERRECVHPTPSTATRVPLHVLRVIHSRQPPPKTARCDAEHPYVSRIAQVWGTHPSVNRVFFDVPACLQFEPRLALSLYFRVWLPACLSNNQVQHVMRACETRPGSETERSSPGVAADLALSRCDSPRK